MWSRTIPSGLLLIHLAYGVRAVLDEDASAIIRFSLEAVGADGVGGNPSRLAAFLCFEEDEMVFVARTASRYHVPITVKNPRDKLVKYLFSRDSDLHRSYYLLDADCPGASDLLKEANSTGMFVGPTKWLLIQNSRVAAEGSYDLRELLGSLSIFPDSDVTIGRRLNGSFVELVSVYRPSPGRELIVEDRGFWEDGGGFHLGSPRAASARRKDLRGTSLKSCLVLTDPDSMNHLTDYKDGHVDTIAKANYPWVIFLVEMMNATVSFVTADSWGYRDSNNSWNGMIGMLDRKEIDIGGTAMFFTPERIDVIQYVSLYTPTRDDSRQWYCEFRDKVPDSKNLCAISQRIPYNLSDRGLFIFRRPPLSSVSNVFVLPFRPSVWLASGIFLLLVAGLLFLAWKWEWYTTPTDKRETIGERLSWSDNVLIIIGAVSQQGSTFEPRRVSPRIILLMLFVAVLSLYTSYTANIVALLQSSTSSINSLKKLLDSSLDIGVHDTVYYHHYFPAFQDPVRKAIYERKVVPKGQKPAWMSLEEGVRRLRNGMFAFHAETGPVYKLIQETFQEGEKCGLEEIDHLHVLDPLLAIQKRSPYLEIVKVGVLKIHEAGLQTRHITRLYTKKPICHGHTSFVSVGLIDSYSAFAILAWGLLLSLVILIGEVLWRRRKLLPIN